MVKMVLAKLLGRIEYGMELNQDHNQWRAPSSVEAKNALSHTSTPPIRVHAWCSVKAKGRLYL